MFSSAGRDRRKTRPVEGLYHWLSKNNLRYSLSTKGFSFEVSLTAPRGRRIVTPLETRLLASIFGTLLSSQGSDAHRVPVRWTRRRGNPSNLPACFMGVKSVTRSQSGRIRARLALGGRTHSSRLPGRLRPPAEAIRTGGRTAARAAVRAGVSSRDRPASGDALGAHPVVSVPP